jgi:dihydrofolate reductase
MMQLSIIAALANQKVIGYHNRLPWHLPADLRHFKEITMGKPVIMGRRTFDSIGRPLPGRSNIIISRNSHFIAEGCLVVHSLAGALAQVTHVPEAMIIGGTEIFRQALPLAQKLYLTFIHADIKGDVFFPEWQTQEWQETARQDFETDDQNAYAYSFAILERKVNV